MTYIDKRLNYFDGQFLTATDFNDEQAYHIDRLRRACRMALKPGIIDGLQVVATNKQLTVKPGVAIDLEGRQIVLKEPLTFTLDLDPVLSALTEDVHVVFRYVGDKLCDAQNQPTSVVGATSGATRWLEKSEITFLDHQPATSDGFELGYLEIEVTGNPRVFKELYNDSNHPGVSSDNPRVDTGARICADARRDGWLRLPFLPLSTNTGSPNIKASFTLQSSYAESSTIGAKGVLPIPIPIGSTKAKNLLVIYQGNTHKIHLEVILAHWIVTSIDQQQKDCDIENTSASDTYTKMVFPLEIVVDAEFDALTLYVETQGTSKIWTIAIEFE